MKFLIDMSLSPDLVSFLSEKGHEAVHATEIGLYTAPDEVVLGQSRKEGRILLTADLDFPRLLALLHSQSPGVVLFRHGDFSKEECRMRLKAVLEKTSEADLSKSLVVVDRYRIRKRPLPISTTHA